MPLLLPFSYPSDYIEYYISCDILRLKETAACNEKQYQL